MRRLARWHIWLGWLIGLPLVMWTVTGLVMVARPIETVRGTHLRADTSQIDKSLPAQFALPAALDLSGRTIERIEILHEARTVAIELKGRGERGQCRLEFFDARRFKITVQPGIGILRRHCRLQQADQELPGSALKVCAGEFEIENIGVSQCRGGLVGNGSVFVLEWEPGIGEKVHWRHQKQGKSWPRPGPAGG